MTTFPLKQKKEIIRLVKSILPRLKFELFIFGSHAKGKARKNSDLDLIVKTRRLLKFSEMAFLKEAFEESDLPYKVDLVDFRCLDSDYRQEINHSKIKIYPS